MQQAHIHEKMQGKSLVWRIALARNWEVEIRHFERRILLQYMDCTLSGTPKQEKAADHMTCPLFEDLN